MKFLWLEIQRKNWIILTLGSYVILSQRSFILLKILVLFYDLDVHIFTILLVNQDKSTFCIFLIISFVPSPYLKSTKLPAARMTVRHDVFDFSNSISGHGDILKPVSNVVLLPC